MATHVTTARQSKTHHRGIQTKMVLAMTVMMTWMGTVNVLCVNIYCSGQIIVVWSLSFTADVHHISSLWIFRFVSSRISGK